MNPESTTKTPAQNEAVESANSAPSPTGIDWINLMMISEHPQPDVSLGEGQANWIFRIELDTPLTTESVRRKLDDLLRAKKFKDAGKYLLDVRGGDDETIEAFIEAAFRNAAPPTRAGLVSESLTTAEVVVQVIEDFGNNAKPKKAARAQFDVALPDAEDLDALRDLTAKNRKQAGKKLRDAIDGSDRAKRVVTAALD